MSLFTITRAFDSALAGLVLLPGLFAGAAAVVLQSL